MFVDMSKKELRVSDCNGKNVVKWSFSLMEGEKVFVCVDLYDQEDYIEIKRHRIITMQELEEQAPLNQK